jgi:hypothetical protein
VSSSCIRPAPLLVIAAACVLVAAGCGGGQRKAVSRYIQQVDAVETEMARPLAQIAQGLKTYSSTGKGTSASDSAHAQRTLTALHERLMRLDPPPPARTLHTLVVRLVGDEAELAGELHRTAVFLPRFKAAVAPLKPVTATLDRTLRSSRTAATQARALSVYSNALDAPLASLASLHPSSVLRPAYDTQVQRLQRLRKGAVALAAALRSGKRTAAAAAVVAFEQAARTGNDVAAQKAQIAAVKAYNAKVARIEALTGRVRAQLSALASLG